MTGFTTVILGLCCLTISNTAAELSTNEEGCLYKDVDNKFYGCFYNNFNGTSFHKLMMDVLENDVTGVELLSQLSSTCRDEQLLETYRTCTNSVTAECPQYTSIITNAVDEHVSVFCENGAPSSRLSTILENGYFNDNNCTEPEPEPRVINDEANMFIRCSNLSNIDWVQLATVTVPEYFSALQSAHQQWFHCLLDRAPLLPDSDNDGVLDCGSTRQNIVLTFALWMSSLEQLGVSLGQEDINKLQAIRQ